VQAIYILFFFSFLAFSDGPNQAVIELKNEIQTSLVGVRNAIAAEGGEANRIYSLYRGNAHRVIENGTTADQHWIDLTNESRDKIEQSNELINNLGELLNDQTDNQTVDFLIHVSQEDFEIAHVNPQIPFAAKYEYPLRHNVMRILAKIGNPRAAGVILSHARQLVTSRDNEIQQEGIRLNAKFIDVAANREFLLNELFTNPGQRPCEWQSFISGQILENQNISTNVIDSLMLKIRSHNGGMINFELATLIVGLFERLPQEERNRLKGQYRSQLRDRFEYLQSRCNRHYSDYRSHYTGVPSEHNDPISSLSFCPQSGIGCAERLRLVDEYMEFFDFESSSEGNDKAVDEARNGRKSVEKQHLPSFKKGKSR